MSLAYFGTLTPRPSGIATIRFSVPVILETFRIIPAGAAAFRHVQGCTGETSPSHFSLKIYSNALMLPTDIDPKPKATNTLLSTQLDYVDEMLDWKFSITPQASSRLVIVHGSFEKLTIAIYGQVLTEGLVQPSPSISTSAAMQTTNKHTLPPSIDVATLPDSSQTAKALLRANAANCSLRHILHSLLCYVITPEGPFDEWDKNSGNPLERLLETDTIDAIELMREAIQALRTPLPGIGEDVATRFTSVVTESLGENPDNQTCRLFFEILGYASLQSDSLVLALLEGVSSATYLADPRFLDDDNVLKHLERWISHPLVASYLNTPDMHEYILAGRDQGAPVENMQRWEQLQGSITQWGEFYSVFDSAEEAALERVSRWLRASLSNSHFGPLTVWRLWNQPSIMEFSSDDPFLVDYSNLTIGTRHFLPESVSPLEVFRASLKVYMGVATVLSVVWWCRFPPDAVACRSLSVLKLWAESDGIREIARTLVLAPVFYEALMELAMDIPLHKSGLYAQQLFEALDVSVNETADMPISEVAIAPELPQLSGHLHVMLKFPQLDDVAVKRASMASRRILHLLKDTPDEPWPIFADAHRSTSEAFVLTQIEVFSKLGKMLNTLAEAPLDTTTVPAMANLLSALTNVAEAISMVIANADLPACTARSLVRSATLVFISSDLVLSRNRRQTQIIEQAHIMRETCVQLLRTFVALDISLGTFVSPGAEHVLAQVLGTWLERETEGSMHIWVSQTAVLVDSLLSSPTGGAAQYFWVKEIVKEMRLLEQLLAVLSPHYWTILVLRIVELDSGNQSVGLGPWLAFNELHTLGALAGRIALDANPGKLAVMLHVMDRSFGLLGTLLQDILRDDTAGFLMRNSQALSTLVQCFEILVDNHVTTAATAGLATVLAPFADDEPRALRRLLATALLRGCRLGSPFSSLLAIPPLLVPHRAFATRDMDLEVLGTDIGLALVAICAAREEVSPQAEICGAVVDILVWVSEYEDSAAIHLYGLDQPTINYIKAFTHEHAVDRAPVLDSSLMGIASSETVPDDLRTATAVISDASRLNATPADLRAATSRKQVHGSRDSTPAPKHGPFDILALASLSPRAPTSPATPNAPLSLTKVYSRDEFRSV